LGSYTYKCRFRNKFDGIASDVKDREQFRNHSLS
jgi:hypothetical protein